MKNKFFYNRSTLMDYICILIGTGLIALSVQCIYDPINMVTGGFSGLSIIIKSLSKEHFVEGLRGKGGGYRLTHAPEDYSVASILKITEGTLAPVSCLADECNTCERASYCNTLPMWTGLYHAITDYLEGVSLSDLVPASSNGDDYVI